MLILSLALGHHELELSIDLSRLDKSGLSIPEKGEVHSEVRVDQNFLKILALVMRQVLAGHQSRGLERETRVVLNVRDPLGA